MSIDFNDHNKVINAIADVQSSEKDMRQASRDAKLFITKRDGQWDPYAWKKMKGRYRGTFDMCTPIVDGISGEIDESDFTIKVSPVGGQASMDTAKTLDGLIRNIRNISNAETVFSQASRSNVIGGFDAWEVVQDWVDGDSFDQDLFIRRIPNAVDSVWFDPASTMQDRSDANWCVKLVSMPTQDYLDKWPKGSKQSMGEDKQSVAYYQKIESVTVAKFMYKKPVNIEIVRMTDGKVYEDNEDFKKVKDDLANPQPNQLGVVAQPVTIEVDDEGNEKRRTRKSWRVHSRMMDGNGWLQESEKTVFDHLPVIPIYGNFDIFENKTIYFGKIEKLYDAQRTLNYAMSRDIEDGALSPSPFMQMTGEQIEGYVEEYENMNTDNKPVRQYNHVDMVPPPFMQGGVQVSSGLQTTIANTQQMISASANSFNALQGNALAAQSGIAGAQQIEQGNIGSIKWFKSLEVSVCQTAKVLINAIPRVYDSTRQVRVLEEDGTSSMVVLNEKILDQNTGQNVELNDLSVGEYDVVCDFGPAFNSQQKETGQAFLDMAAIDPTIAQQGMDVWLKNLNVPGMDQMAERYREQLLNAGVIPESQWTDEERQKIEQQQAEAQQQEPQEDPNMVLAKAEELKGQAEMTNAQNKTTEIQGSQQLKAAELQLSSKQLDLDTQKFLMSKEDNVNIAAAKIAQADRKLDQEAYKLELAERDQFVKNALAIQAQDITKLTTALEQLTALKENVSDDAYAKEGENQ